MNPLAQLFILSFVFSTLLKTPSQGVPFSLFLYAGLLPWLFFSSAVLASSESVLGAYHLVTTVYFPRELLVVAAVLSRVADLIAGSVIFAGLLVYHGYPIDVSMFWIPLVFFLQALFTIGLSMPIAALNLFFHDVRFLVGVGLNLWFFVTPVMYPPELVPSQYGVLYDLNPLGRFIGSYRGYMFAGESPTAANLLVGGLMAVVTLTIGFYIFKRLEPHFADRI